MTKSSVCSEYGFPITSKNIDVRFIEYMPFDGNKWSSKKMVSFKEMLTIIARHYGVENIMKLQDAKNDTTKV